MEPEYATLNTLRIEHDLTWEQLADLIEKSGAGKISAGTLHFLLTREDTNPRDRTVHKIRVFLKTAERRRLLVRKRKSE